MSANVDLELGAVVAKLTADERKQVLEYARSLPTFFDERPSPSVLDLVGTISKEDGRLMLEAIEEMFERVP